MASRHRFVVGGRERTVVIDEIDGRVTAAIDDGPAVEIDATTSGVPGLFSILIDGAPAHAYVSRRGQGFEVTVDGRRFELLPAARGRARAAVGGLEDPPGKVTAPLAGMVVSVHVAVGDAIEPGQLLVVVEAMKMQNEVSSPHPGVVTALHCEQGQRVEQSEVLLEYEPAE